MFGVCFASGALFRFEYIKLLASGIYVYCSGSLEELVEADDVIKAFVKRLSNPSTSDLKNRFAQFLIYRELCFLYRFKGARGYSNYIMWLA